MDERLEKALNLSIATPSESLYTGNVSSVRFPLEDGSASALPSHAPLAASLGCGGVLTLTENETNRHFFLEGGFIEISSENISVLANAGLPVEEIDLTGAEKELAEALAEKASGDRAIERRLKRIQSARIRIRAAKSANFLSAN